MPVEANALMDHLHDDEQPGAKSPPFVGRCPSSHQASDTDALWVCISSVYNESDPTADGLCAVLPFVTRSGPIFSFLVDIQVPHPVPQRRYAEPSRIASPSLSLCQCVAVAVGTHFDRVPAATMLTLNDKVLAL
jgi:hypothetical protein